MNASVLLGQSLSTLGIKPSKPVVPLQEEDTQSTTANEPLSDPIADSQTENPEEDSSIETSQEQQDFSNALLPPDTDTRDLAFSH